MCLLYACPCFDVLYLIRSWKFCNYFDKASYVKMDYVSRSDLLEIGWTSPFSQLLLIQLTILKNG